MKYYYIKSKKLFAKGENWFDNYLYKDGKWVKDTDCLVSDRLFGYDKYDDSPYGFGCTDIMDDIVYITEDDFNKFCNEKNPENIVFSKETDNKNCETAEDVKENLEEIQSPEMLKKQFEEFIDAIADKDHEKVRKMIKKDIDVNMTNENGRTPLMMAVQKDDLYMITKLIQAGADIEQKADNNETAFLYACRVANNVKTIMHLIKEGANITAKNTFGNNALFVAAEYNKNCEIVEYLIDEQICDINDQNCDYNYTPLMAAARYNTIEVVNVLINHGANLYAKDSGGWLPVFHAAANYDDNPMNLIRLIGLNPQMLFFKTDKENLRQISVDNHNRNICEVLDALLSIYCFANKSSENPHNQP